MPSPKPTPARVFDLQPAPVHELDEIECFLLSLQDCLGSLPPTKSSANAVLTTNRLREAIWRDVIE